MLYKGIPFNGGMDSPSGTGAQHIVQTCEAIVDYLIDASSPGQLVDISTVPCVAWLDRQLIDDSGNKTADWEQCQLFIGAGNATVDWLNCALLDNTNGQSVDWINRELDDAVDTLAISWGARTLHTTSGTTIFSWDSSKLGWFNVTSVVQQTGGAATAGAVYTATEQGMINRMYTALRNYGLLT